MNNNLLGMLGLAKRGGMLTAGERGVADEVRVKNARLLLLAADAADNTTRRIQHFAKAGACLWIRVPFTKAELGRAAGHGSCAILAVTDIRFAAAVAHRLAEMDAARYGSTAQKLDVKAKRAAERKTEQYRCAKAERRQKMKAEISAKSTQSGRKKAPQADGPKGKNSHFKNGNRLAHSWKHSSEPTRRYAHSHPVKKGKGSLRKENGRK